MLTSSLVDGTSVIIASWEGTLTVEDVKALRDAIGFVSSTYGEARILVDLPDAARADPIAVWADLKSIGAVGDLQRMALVTDERWAEALADVAGAVLPGDVEVFDTARRDEAVAWAAS